MEEKVDSEISRSAVYANSYRVIAPSCNSTGFLTHSLRHRALSYATNPRIAEEFLVNTRLIRNDRETETSILAYFSDAAALMLSRSGIESCDGRERRPLPESVPLRMEYKDIVRKRRSCRIYTGDPLELEFVATILRSTGITGTARTPISADGMVEIDFRAVPSGGGLYPVDLYISAEAVKGLPRGIYKFDPGNATLITMGGAADSNALLKCFSVPEELISLSRAGAIFLLIGRPWRAMRKYGARGMRFLFHEAGALSEHIHHTSVALGMGSVDCASIFDDEAHDVLMLDGLFQTLLHTVVIGYPG